MYISVYINIDSYYKNLVDKNILQTFINWITSTQITDIDIINVLIERIERSIENKKFVPPYRKIQLLLDEKIKNQCTFTREEVLREVHILKKNLEKNKSFLNCITLQIHHMLNIGNIYGLLSGNINKKLSDNILQKIDIFKKVDINIISCLPDLSGDIMYIEDNENKKDKNSAIKVLYYIDTIEKGITTNWKEIICISHLLESIIHNEYFYRLRTLEELGYIVGTYNIDLNGTFINKLYIGFIIQSYKLNAVELYKKTRDTINTHINKKIIDLPEKELEDSINGLLSQLKEKDNNIYEQMSRLLSYIRSKNPNLDVLFDTKEQLISFLEQRTITTEKIQEYFKNKFITSSKIISIGIQSKEII